MIGRNLIDYPDALIKRRTFGHFDDFSSYTTAGVWTSIISAGAVASVGDVQGGILSLAPTDSTDNLFAGIRTTNSPFLFATGKAIHLEVLLQFTEANTSAANVIFGLMSAPGTTPMQSNGAGPKASFTGAVIYKVDGGTQWKTCCSVGTTQTIAQSDTTAGGTTQQRLEIDINPTSSTLAEITYYVDGVQLKVTGGRPGTSLIHDYFTYTGQLQMGFFVGVMNGSTTPETLLVDYLSWAQTARLFT